MNNPDLNISDNTHISNINDNNFEKNSSLSIENEPFYFESDTLALRNNSDYSSVLKTLVLLEAQRIRACNDLEKLIQLKEDAMKDPLNFVNVLKLNQDKNEFPAKQKIYLLPELDWNKYYDCIDLDDLEAIKNHTKQRTHSLRQANKIIQQQNESAKSQPINATTKSQLINEEDDEKRNSRNYNKPWTVEEQRVLEELLIEFPPEDKEAARWRKIANKLGTRTPLQVQSHCQKYFIKLAKAGLPIPGRMPNLKTYVTKKGTRGNKNSSLMRGACHAIGLGSGRSNINNINQMNKRMVGRGSSLNEISSMWSSFNPPIVMNDDEKEQNDNDYDEYQDNIDEENEVEDFENDIEENDNYEGDEITHE
jgi:hypothetical protein